MIANGCLFALMLIATATDIWRQKIYNWTTYTGIVVGLGLTAWATTASSMYIADIGFTDSLLGFLGCGVIMLVCFVLFQIGGGDVKLLAMVGAFLGVQRGIEVLLWTFVIGAAMAVLILIWKIGAIRLIKRIVQQIGYRLRLGAFEPPTDAEKQQLQVPLYLAPSALLAVLIVVFLR